MKRINLALQGGGAHGAFTWGVLDRFLDEEDVEVAAITGTSAGALNGAAFKSGMVHAGRDGARASLDAVWARMGAIGDLRMAHWFRGVEPAAISRAMEYSVPYSIGEAWSRMVSPYAYGPFYSNPLEAVVDRFNFAEVCADEGPRLFVCATCVRSGKIRVFTGDEISTDAILASACLPTLFKAVEIYDPETERTEAYWDGGYTGNPALYPLFNDDLPDDVVIVNINPLERDEVPVTPQQIQNRINEISFNSSLFRELRAISFVQRLLKEGKLKPGEMNRVLVHMIADNELMNSLSVATKTVPNPVILHKLKEAGRRAADDFLVKHKADLGQNSTVDLPAMFG
ncbi:MULTISPECIES: patatin-like phospholipase family protein [unclassified Ruegeria]|uniref:patatin-like phospholipase family protein n=1 Tax=unclassified Ruegeria TaxID=2625375 RepID=UPI0014895C46|nr:MULTISPECIES: patatin-like phospholipase family protein [unclassified Ruegeria]NOD34012.1 patatin-like phospholipase family protein [Ruegeria sp. HKCCD7296]NOD46413.1 patatin-like phospholipase family protein [Ruegeria sp. HKCCD5849]NOD50287.1 patatin-like phospholipase family protein [Ruegeria sp. HKCCD5851]NOD67122.1 patatin-like phospholipase family protein [Ruegeria sp. HKCCD7303]NOE32711.1 patatin-like phospholipase family protein [Ruegeria sp. HKCCD7318]